MDEVKARKIGANIKLLIGALVLVLGVGYYWVRSSQELSESLRLMKDGDVTEQIFAIRTVAGGDWDSTEVLNALGELVYSQDEEVRFNAIEALLKLDQDTATLILSEALSSGDSAVRITALESLERLNTPEASKLIESSRREHDAYNQKGFDVWANRFRKEYGLPVKKEPKKKKHHRPKRYSARSEE